MRINCGPGMVVKLVAVTMLIGVVLGLYLGAYVITI
jgi:hypothetical protein